MLLAFSKQKPKIPKNAVVQMQKKTKKKKNTNKKNKKPKRIENCKQNTLQTYLNLSEMQRNSRKLH